MSRRILRIVCNLLIYKTLRTNSEYNQYLNHNLKKKNVWEPKTIVGCEKMINPKS